MYTLCVQYYSTQWCFMHLRALRNGIRKKLYFYYTGAFVPSQGHMEGSANSTARWHIEENRVSPVQQWPNDKKCKHEKSEVLTLAQPDCCAIFPIIRQHCLVRTLAGDEEHQYRRDKKIEHKSTFKGLRFYLTTGTFLTSRQPPFSLTGAHFRPSSQDKIAAWIWWVQQKEASFSQQGGPVSSKNRWFWQFICQTLPDSMKAWGRYFDRFPGL